MVMSASLGYVRLVDPLAAVRPDAQLDAPLEPLVDALCEALNRAGSARSARGIASAMGQLIQNLHVQAGVRLPTVRFLAGHLGVSPTTISDAWNALIEAGLIETRGRQGTFVIGPSRVPAPRRYRQVFQGHEGLEHDLSTGAPDPDLLPDLSEVVALVAKRPLKSSYLDHPVDPGLNEIVRGLWPFEPQSLTIVDGALDGLDRVISALVRFGDRVVVETPTFPPLLDLLEQIGAIVIGVPVDEHGVMCQPLAQALKQPTAMCIFQPRAHNPTGASWTDERLDDIAKLVSAHPCWLVEDDHSGGIATSHTRSLGQHHPDRTIRIESFSKGYGPDLRLAALGGAAEAIDRVVARRMLGPGWSSLLVQMVLAELLTSQAAISAVEAARTTYANRRAALRSALLQRGVVVANGEGINLWIGVDDERSAQVALAAQGIGVAPGSPFMVPAHSTITDPRSVVHTDHVRVTISKLGMEVDDLADAIAKAVRTSQGPYGMRRARNV